MNSGEPFAEALAAHEDSQRPSAITALLTAAKEISAECRAGGDATRSALASLCMAMDGIDSLSEVVKLDEYDKLVERCVEFSEQVEMFRGLYAHEAHKTQVLLEERALLLAEISRRDAMSQKRLELWRGECGHHWIKSELDACPICKVKTIATAYYADSKKLLDYELESISGFLSSSDTGASK